MQQPVGFYYNRVAQRADLSRFAALPGPAMRDVLRPYALFGRTKLALFAKPGAIFAGGQDHPKTTRDATPCARLVASRTATVALMFAAGFLSRTQVSYRGVVRALLAAVAALALAVAVKPDQSRREGIAVAGTAVSIAAATASFFVAVYTDVLPSSINAAYSLTVLNASATAKTLAMLTAFTAILLPLVLLHRDWTYGAFGKRIGAGDVPAPVTPSGRPEGSTGSAGQLEPAR